MEAAERGNTDVIDNLLEAHADTNIQEDVSCCYLESCTT